MVFLFATDGRLHLQGVVSASVVVPGEVAHGFVARFGVAAESVSRSMRIELLNRKTWDTRVELSATILGWIEAPDNQQRRHPSMGDISPDEYER